MKREKPLVLVADDEAHILHVVSLKLQHAGFEALTVEDGEDALALAVEHLPDVIVSDYSMPGLSGVQLCHALKAHDATRRTPIIMLTAHGCRLPADLQAETNCVAIVTKPFSPRELLGKIAEAVGQPLKLK